MKLELDPAAALIATCARCTFDDRQRRDIRAVLERGVDWERALALAEKNFVNGLGIGTALGVARARPDHDARSAERAPEASISLSLGNGTVM